MKRPPADPASAAVGGRDAAADQRRRALAQGLVGKKVSLSTTDFHHVVGRLVAIEPGPPEGEGDRLRIFVNNQELLIRWQGVARIHEADPALAEYMK
jgi:hypothetical protein